MAVAECIYELFNIYATWTEGDRICAVDESGIRRLCRDLDLLEGVPPRNADAYVHEVMLRVDPDQDGLLGISDFMLWFLTEVAALLPFRCSSTGPCAPLYNRLLHFMLGANAATGVRQKACGLGLNQFVRMCQDCNLTSDSSLARKVLQVASSQASCQRVLGKMEGGKQLQLAQVVHTLRALSDHLNVTIDTMLYRIVGNGSHPPALRPNGNEKGATVEQVSKLLLESGLERPLRWTSYRCEVCGDEHSRWMISDVSEMKAYFRLTDQPYLPNFRIVNTRNARAVFHRYNAKFNKGLPHPESSTFNMPAEEKQRCRPADASLGADAEGRTQEPCCCQYRSLSLMELSTFLKLCQDNQSISDAIKLDNRPLMLHRMEAAFMVACSIGGVFCLDSSFGIHNKPITTRNIQCPSSFSHLSSPSGIRRPTYGTPFNASSTKALRISGRCMSAAARSSQPAPSAHRQAVPTLTFPQFLEALRLLAEEMVGPPQPLMRMEMTLWRILHDMVEVGCPLPKGHKWIWSAERPKHKFEQGSPLWLFYHAQDAS